MHPRAAALLASSLLSACGAAPDVGSDSTDATASTSASTTGASTTASSTAASTDVATTGGPPTSSTTLDASSTSTAASSGASTGEPAADAWIQRFGAPEDQHPTGLGFAPQGDLWVAGDFFAQSLELGTGPLMGDGTGLYLGKYAPDGAALHSQALFPADGAPTLSNVAGLAVDGAGAVVLTGWLEGSYTVGGAPLVADEVDFYVGKWDAAGAPLWGQKFGAADWQVSYSLAIAGDDSIWIGGATLAPFEVGDIALTGTASTGMFAVRLAADGAPILARWWGDVGDQEVRGIAACADGSAAIAGFFTAPLQFGAELVEPAGDKDMFVARITATGDPAWIRAYGSASVDYAALVHCDDAVTFAGLVAGAAQVGDLELDPAGDTDVVVGRLDADGALAWATGVTGPADQRPTGLVARPGGETLLALTSAGATKFGAQEHTSAGDTDLFVARYTDTDPNPAELQVLGDRGAQSAGPLALGPAGAAALAGTISGTVAWPGLPPVTAAGPVDLVLVHFMTGP